MFFRGEVEVMRVSRALYLQTVDDRRAEGWKVISQTADETVLRKKGQGGSVLGHLAVGVFTAGLGNFIYDQNKRQKSSRELRVRVQ